MNGRNTTAGWAGRSDRSESIGWIVNIAARFSFQGGIRVPSHTVYNHGVAGLTRILADEWTPKGFNENAIAPGSSATNNTEALWHDPDCNKAIRTRISAGSWATRPISRARRCCSPLRQSIASPVPCSTWTVAGWRVETALTQSTRRECCAG
nr:SDR family oxidoreductase [Aliiruegeria sabulilitoris]